MATQHVISAEIRLATEKYLKSLGEIEARHAKAMGGVATGGAQAGDAVEKGATRGSKALVGMGDAAGRLAAQLAGAFTMRELVKAAADMEKLQVGLEAVTGSSAKARQELEFIRQLSNRIGADVTETGKAWLGFQAAIKGTAVEGEVGRQVFEAVSTSMAKAGKSSAETGNALLALQQIASKGTVSMEELRQQLGEALPGALQAAAKGMGITTAQLIQMVESGQVAAQDLFPALTKGLNDLYGGAPAAQTLAQEITNIKNAFVEMAANIGEAGGLDALKLGAEGAQAAMVLLDATLVATGKTIGIVAGAIATMDFSQVKTMLAEVEAEAQAKLTKAALHNDTLRASIEALGTESDRAALKAAQSAAATEKTAQAAAAASPSYIALAAAYGEVRKELAAQIELADKQVAAAKARGEATVAEAKLLGDEAALRQAIGAAAAGEAAALTDLAAKRQTEVDVLRAELENKQLLLKASGDQSNERKKEISELEQMIAKKQVEADTSRAQAAAAQLNARAKGEEVQAAQAALAATQAATTARVADAQASLSLLETQKSLAQQSQQLAELMGNEEAARNFRIQQLEIDIKITRAKAEVARAEAEGSIAVAQATMAELRAKGELTAVKEAELNASIRLAQAKLKEADAIQQSARVTEQAISNIRNYGDEAGSAAAKSGHATDKIREGWDGVADSTREATRAVGEYNDKLGEGVQRVGSGGQLRNKDGMASDAAGNTISMSGRNTKDRDGREVWYSSRMQLGPGQFTWINELQRQNELRQANAETGLGVNVTNITIDGRKRTVRTADAESARVLEEVVRELGAAKGRAA